MTGIRTNDLFCQNSLTTMPLLHLMLLHLVMMQ